jgi:predicted dehydrogenase
VETKVKVGLIGTGMISKAYLRGARAFEILDIVACSDIDLERAKAVATEWNIPRVCSVAELLADPEIQLVINLTIPKVHAQVSLDVIAAGKHVYSEKPFATTLADGQHMLAAARERNVLVGCAPETFLGGAHQTCRRLIDDGAIGRPLAAFMSFARFARGGAPERDFMFQVGAGPMLDMGPYYLTALVNMLGPIKRVTGSVSLSSPVHVVRDGPYQGREIAVETPTHLTGALDFASGPTATVITSFDIHREHNLPLLEIYGSEGILAVPDPNYHGGTIRLRRPGDKEWSEVPHNEEEGFTRGFGVADLASAIIHQRPVRASGELAYHVLETMLAFERSSREERHIALESQPGRPDPIPANLPKGQFDPSEPAAQ